MDSNTRQKKKIKMMNYRSLEISHLEVQKTIRTPQRL